MTPCGSFHALVLGVLLSPALLQVTVTNHAGHAVSGDFGGVTNGTVVVSGRAYPLSVFPKAEQLRLKKLAGIDVRSARQKRLDRARALRLERLRLREQEGEIDKTTAGESAFGSR